MWIGTNVKLHPGYWIIVALFDVVVNLYIVCTYKFKAWPVTGLILPLISDLRSDIKKISDLRSDRKKISDLWLAQVWYLTDNAWLGVHYCRRNNLSKLFRWNSSRCRRHRRCLCPSSNFSSVRKAANTVFSFACSCNFPHSSRDLLGKQIYWWNSLRAGRGGRSDALLMHERKECDLLEGANPQQRRRERRWSEVARLRRRRTHRTRRLALSQR